MSANQRYAFLCLATSFWGYLHAQQPVPIATFGNNGVALIQNTGTTPNVFISDIAEDAQQRSFASGHVDVGGLRRAFVQCFTPNGQLDQSFAEGGRYTSPIELGWLTVRSIVVRPDGRILLAAARPAGTVLLQLLPNGTPDPNFGVNGLAEYSAMAAWTTNEMVLGPDGSIYLTGHANSMAFLAHLLPAGALDMGFGINGISQPTPSDFPCIGANIMLAPSGYIVISGIDFASPPSSGFLASVDLNGTPSSSFGTNGFVLINNWPTSLEKPYHADMAPDGSILVAGRWYRNNVNSMFLLRYLADGTVDGSFADQGVLDIPQEPGVQRVDPNPIILPDGSTLVVGAQSGPSAAQASIYVTRVSVEGALDPEMGADGTYYFRRNGFLFSTSYSSFLRSDGSLAVSSVLFESAATKNAVVVFSLNDLSTDVRPIVNETSSLLVFPNPAKDMIVLRGLDSTGAITLELLDQLGRAVHEWSIPSTHSTDEIHLSLPASLANSRYIIGTRTSVGQSRTLLDVMR